MQPATAAAAADRSVFSILTETETENTNCKAGKLKS